MSIKHLQKILCFLTLPVLLTSCSSAPTVDKNWLNANCPPFPHWTADSCSSYNNCTQTGLSSVCKCNFSSGAPNTQGVYEGELKKGKRHGWGKYVWNTGGTYIGHWKDGNRLCGIEENSSYYYVYKGGKLSEKKSTTEYADAFLGALAIGVIGAAVTQGGTGTYTGYSGGNSDYDWDWDLINSSDCSGTQWVCRGVTTKKFATHDKCQFDTLDDDRWIGLGSGCYR